MIGQVGLGILAAMFSAIRTDRLVVRPMRSDDATGLFERRNDPQVAAFQSWQLPFPLERAVAMVEDVAAADGPTDGDWWMLAVADPETDEVLGDLALLLGNEGRSAEIGYTFGPDSWGHGYAVEAVEALVEQLFDVFAVTRVSAMLHPDNRPSVMVLERTGFLFEGHTRLSYWVGDQNSDDLIYGLTRPDWEEWRDRVQAPPATVQLTEVTPYNFKEVYALQTHKSQESFVAPMPRSLAQALIAPMDGPGTPQTAWMRAIEADGDVAGFVMLALVDGEDEGPFLWRLLMDRLHQRRGIAGRALDMVEDELRGMGETKLVTSWIPGRGSPEPFYRARGFEPTGELEGDEVVALKAL